MGYEVHMNFADESVCLSADNIQNEVVATHRSKEVLDMMSPYMKTILPPLEEVLICSLKLFCRKICNSHMNSFI
jgi:hypothetical protein